MATKNFRQVGRASTVSSSRANAFSLRKQRPKEPTSSSIPSKFAKRPYVAPTLDKCFGSRTSRFEKTRQTRQPGPGQYYEEQAFIRATPSQSSRGFGSMASKANRFRGMSNHTRTPAPGHYTADNLTTKPIAPMREESDSVFKSRTSKLTFMDAKIGLNTPAPGVYNLEKAKTKIYGKSSTFSSRTARCTYMKDFLRDSPAPGAYNPAKIKSKPANKHSVMFTSRQDRIPSKPNTIPGPGEYNFYKSFVTRHEQPNKTSKLHTRNSSYANDNLDRWGKPYQSKVERGPIPPGPGQYAKEYKPKSKKPVSSSWALSNVGRWRNGSSFQMRTPGPAYYATRTTRKSDDSFHLNKAGRWL